MHILVELSILVSYYIRIWKYDMSTITKGNWSRKWSPIPWTEYLSYLIKTSFWKSVEKSKHLLYIINSFGSPFLHFKWRIILSGKGSVFKFVNLSDGFSILENATKNTLESNWIIFLHFQLVATSLSSHTRMFRNYFPTTYYTFLKFLSGEFNTFFTSCFRNFYRN